MTYQQAEKKAFRLYLQYKTETKEYADLAIRLAREPNDLTRVFNFRRNAMLEAKRRAKTA